MIGQYHQPQLPTPPPNMVRPKRLPLSPNILGQAKCYMMVEVLVIKIILILA